MNDQFIVLLLFLTFTRNIKGDKTCGVHKGVEVVTAHGVPEESSMNSHDESITSGGYILRDYCFTKTAYITLVRYWTTTAGAPVYLSTWTPLGEGYELTYWREMTGYDMSQGWIETDDRDFQWRVSSGDCIGLIKEDSDVPIPVPRVHSQAHPLFAIEPTMATIKAATNGSGYGFHLSRSGMDDDSGQFYMDVYYDEIPSSIARKQSFSSGSFDADEYGDATTLGEDLALLLPTVCAPISGTVRRLETYSTALADKQTIDIWRKKTHIDDVFSLVESIELSTSGGYRKETHSVNLSINAGDCLGTRRREASSMAFGAITSLPPDAREQLYRAKILPGIKSQDVISEINITSMKSLYVAIGIKLWVELKGRTECELNPVIGRCHVDATCQRSELVPGSLYCHYCECTHGYTCGSSQITQETDAITRNNVQTSAISKVIEGTQAGLPMTSQVAFIEVPTDSIEVEFSSVSFRGIDIENGKNSTYSTREMAVSSQPVYSDYEAEMRTADSVETSGLWKGLYSTGIIIILACVLYAVYAIWQWKRLEPELAAEEQQSRASKLSGQPASPSVAHIRLVTASPSTADDEDNYEEDEARVRIEHVPVEQATLKPSPPSPKKTSTKRVLALPTQHIKESLRLKKKKIKKRIFKKK